MSKKNRERQNDVISNADTSPTDPIASAGSDTGPDQWTHPSASSRDNFLPTLFARLREARQKEPRVPRLMRSRTRLRGKRRIGSGGLGVVYEFHDCRLARRVAVKVARHSAMGCPDRLQRFLREREITAGLQHPAIPPVFQSGKVRDGRPYYVMRLIEGDTLSARIKQMLPESAGDFRTNDDFRRLLEAFLDVCAAVQYAHEQNILHRDIKPSNIMLEKGGATFLVDWGLAREIGAADRLADETAGSAQSGSGLTADGQQLGSPDWMSPEQAAGRTDLHGVATDIYGLGATLYHILTGRGPHTDKRQSGMKLADRIEQIATLPARSAVDVSARVPAELSSICEKAMRHSPLDRYATAAALIDDVRRWQQREPVHAHQQKYSFMNRLELFVSRHQRAIVVSVIGLLFMISGSTLSAIQISQSAAAAENALTAEQQANDRLFASLERFADTLMADDVLASPQLKSLRNRVLTDLSQQYEVWSARSTGAQKDLSRAATGTIRLAEIEQQTGDLLHAVALAERAKVLGQKIFEQSDQKSPDDVLPLLDACIAHCRIANAANNSDALASAQQMDAALARSGRLLSAEQLLDYQATLEHLSAGTFYRHAGKARDNPVRGGHLRTALAHAEACVERRAALRKLSDTRENGLSYVAAVNAQALMLHKLGRHEQAILMYETGLQELQELPQQEGGADIDISRLEVSILFNALMTYRARKDVDKAKSAAKRGIDLCRELSAKYPLVIRYREDLGRGYGNLAEALIAQYRVDLEPEILPDLFVTLRTAAETYQAIYRDFPERKEMQAAAAVHYLRLSACLHWGSRDAEALAEFKRCLTLADRPELIENGHQPNAFASATGYALLIRNEQPQAPADHSAAEDLKVALEIAAPMLRVDRVFREMFLKDPVFQSLMALPSIHALYDQLKSER